ncbi:MAG: hypothetical protein GY786_02360, partial [Proteobacteria bacterium]|nr:hypothetical protein [Pseudomonadota bacterium]
MFKTAKSKKIANLTVLGILIVGIAVASWWNARPQPVYVTVTGSELRATELKKGAKPIKFNLSFSDSAAQLKDVGKKLQKGISMSPKIAGEWLWQSDQDLSFTPKQDWPVDQEIIIKFEKTFFPEHINLKDYSYFLKTPEFKAQLRELSFYQNPKEPKDKKVVATINFSHPVDPESFEKSLKIEINRSRNRNKPEWREDNNLALKITYDDFQGKAFIHTARIKSPTYDEELRLTINSGFGTSRGGNEISGELKSEVTIPGMSTYFQINEMSSMIVRDKKNQPEQILLIGSTARMNQGELKEHLEVYLLPKDRPATALEKARKNFRWESPNQISDKILALGRKINVQAIPAANLYENTLSFRYDEAPGRYLYVRIKNGLSSFGGYILSDSFHEVVRVSSYPKELSILNKGSLLSLPGEKKISVLGRGLKAARFTVNRFLPDQIAHLISQTSGDFTSPEFHNYSFNTDNLAEVFAEAHTFSHKSPKEAQYTTFDFSRYLRKEKGSPKGLFLLGVDAWDPVRERSEGVESKRLIVLTDLGLLVKKSLDGSYDLFVQSITGGKPVQGVTVKVIGKNGVPLFKRTSDAQGHVKFPKLSDFVYSESPVAFVATYNEDFSFIPYESHVQQIYYSRYDVGGEYSRNQSQDL